MPRWQLELRLKWNAQFFLKLDRIHSIASRHAHMTLQQQCFWEILMAGHIRSEYFKVVNKLFLLSECWLHGFSQKSPFHRNDSIRIWNMHTFSYTMCILELYARLLVKENASVEYSSIKRIFHLFGDKKWCY